MSVEYDTNQKPESLHATSISTFTYHTKSVRNIHALFFIFNKYLMLDTNSGEVLHSCTHTLESNTLQIDESFVLTNSLFSNIAINESGVDSGCRLIQVFLSA